MSARTLTTIRLYGPLGARFGREFRLSVSSPADAVRALSRMLSGFRETLEQMTGYVFRVRSGGKDRPEETLELPSNGRTISFLPMTQGAASAKGIFSAIGGGILAAIGLVFEQPWLVGLGASIALGGISAMLAPHPRAEASSENKANLPSYQFGGPVNTEQQGGPVPLLYGRMLVGSAVISAGLDVGAVQAAPTLGTGGNSNNGGSANPALPIGGTRYEP